MSLSQSEVEKMTIAELKEWLGARDLRIPAEQKRKAYWVQRVIDYQKLYGSQDPLYMTSKKSTLGSARRTRSTAAAMSSARRKPLMKDIVNEQQTIPARQVSSKKKKAAASDRRRHTRSLLMDDDDEEYSEGDHGGNDDDDGGVEHENLSIQDDFLDPIPSKPSKYPLSVKPSSMTVRELRSWLTDHGIEFEMMQQKSKAYFVNLVTLHSFNSSSQSHRSSAVKKSADEKQHSTIDDEKATEYVVHTPAPSLKKQSKNQRRSVRSERTSKKSMQLESQRDDHVSEHHVLKEAPLPSGLARSPMTPEEVRRRRAFENTVQRRDEIKSQLVSPALSTHSSLNENETESEMEDEYEGREQAGGPGPAPASESDESDERKSSPVMRPSMKKERSMLQTPALNKLGVPKITDADIEHMRSQVRSMLDDDSDACATRMRLTSKYSKSRTRSSRVTRPSDRPSSSSSSTTAAAAAVTAKSSAAMASVPIARERPNITDRIVSEDTHRYFQPAPLPGPKDRTKSTTTVKMRNDLSRQSRDIDAMKSMRDTRIDRARSSSSKSQVSSKEEISFSLGKRDSESAPSSSQESSSRSGFLSGFFSATKPPNDQVSHGLDHEPTAHSPFPKQTLAFDTAVKSTESKHHPSRHHHHSNPATKKSGALGGRSGASLSPGLRHRIGAEISQPVSQQQRYDGGLNDDIHDRRGVRNTNMYHVGEVPPSPPPRLIDPRSELSPTQSPDWLSRNKTTTRGQRRKKSASLNDSNKKSIDSSHDDRCYSFLNGSLGSSILMAIIVAAFAVGAFVMTGPISVETGTFNTIRGRPLFMANEESFIANIPDLSAIWNEYSPQIQASLLSHSESVREWWSSLTIDDWMSSSLMTMPTGLIDLTRSFYSTNNVSKNQVVFCDSGSNSVSGSTNSNGSGSSSSSDVSNVGNTGSDESVSCVPCPSNALKCEGGSVECRQGYLQQSTQCVIDKSVVRVAHEISGTAQSLLAFRLGRHECGHDIEPDMTKEELYVSLYVSDPDQMAESFEYFVFHLSSMSRNIMFDSDTQRFRSKYSVKPWDCRIKEWAIDNYAMLTGGVISVSLLIYLVWSCYANCRDNSEAETLVESIREVLKTHAEENPSTAYMAVDSVRRHLDYAAKRDAVWDLARRKVDGSPSIQKSMRLVNGIQKLCWRVPNSVVNRGDSRSSSSTDRPSRFGRRKHSLFAKNNNIDASIDDVSQPRQSHFMRDSQVPRPLSSIYGQMKTQSSFGVTPYSLGSKSQVRRPSQEGMMRGRHMMMEVDPVPPMGDQSGIDGSQRGRFFGW